MKKGFIVGLLVGAVAGWVYMGFQIINLAKKNPERFVGLCQALVGNVHEDRDYEKRLSSTGEEYEGEQ